MSVRDLLRELPVFAQPLPMFDPDATPAHPNGLFISWLEEAVAAGVVEPHAMTLSTVDASGMPDLRVLLLKEVDDTGWQFTTDMDSAKGRQIAGQPVAALGFYWREQGRQVRVRGSVAPLDRETSARDFLARPLGSRIASLASEQSNVLQDLGVLDQALAAAERAVEDNPDLVSEGHTVYAVNPLSVEFWQGDAQRRHVRLRYRRAGDSWIRELLWP